MHFYVVAAWRKTQYFGVSLRSDGLQVFLGAIYPDIKKDASCAVGVAQQPGSVSH